MLAWHSVIWMSQALPLILPAGWSPPTARMILRHRRRCQYIEVQTKARPGLVYITVPIPLMDITARTAE